MAANTLSLDGKVAVVTGASSGMGERFARVLTDAGATVVVVARRAERLERLASQLEGATVCAADLSRPEDADRVIDVAIEQHGHVDIVVNNAGGANIAPATEEPLDEFERVVRLNLTSPFVIARAAARQMIALQTGGSIINVASILALVGIGRIPQAGYAASKGGLVSLTRELGAQWARQGVRVNALAPGWFGTEMTSELFADDRSAKWLQRLTPMGRPGQLEELDGALLFLAGDASSYVTGQVLTVDGGWTTV